MNKFLIMRQIEIDAGHRVPEHGSGCRNLHGHRYKIEAYCRGVLADSGEQLGMLLDFKFLKAAMMEVIHDRCDHGTMLRFDDKLLWLLAPNRYKLSSTDVYTVKEEGMNLYILPFVPTAENLARHWFEVLAPEVTTRSTNRAELFKLRVWETPNCFAEYPLTG